ncbi:restriction endonuclease subunit S [Paenibacillus pinistramenti]|uniref:restriction endonuclease subunit S n=1 Tax=Paenibacillus pinistramenti TaxID=1768003 RepID=UPI001109F2E4|nr:restriction endonuclease subunit S [Paenibacillus pinistramenti]
MRYKFEDIAFNSTAKKKPTESDKDTYLGLEHLDSGSLIVNRFGSEVAPIGEKLVMKKGDVLFGKRRAYQKKVAIAPFDGIFSAHGMVLRPKEAVIDKGFFPLFMSSDYFLEAAIKISVGSLSPTINWRDLKELEFDLPSLSEQRRLAKLLWAVIKTKNAYKELFNQTEQLVKSQFIEMFGDPKTNSRSLPTTEFVNVVKMQRGFDLPVHQRNSKGSIPIYASNGIIDYHIEAKVPGGGIITGRSGTIGKVYYSLNDYWPLNTTLFSLDINGNNIIYLAYLLEYFDLTRFATGSGVPTLNRNSFHSEQIIDVPLEAQDTFANFVIQADKSKFELKRTMDELEATYKSLLREHLG